MGKTRGADTNSRKAAGNARKAEAAERKRQEEEAREAAQEDAKWAGGSKDLSKKDREAAKKAEADRKKAERDALLAEEEASLPTKPLKSKQRGQEKVANRRAGKIDDFIGTGNGKESALYASGIDDALDALEITKGGKKASDIERHPERRFKAAYAAFEADRLPEIKEERPGMRLNQYKDLIRKEFERSPENPFNQASVKYNASRDEVNDVRQSLKSAAEKRLER
ncbi:hypothetical protein TRVA0_007S03136 [Trichomonascus vanleenenianus]|uniref:coiled-coil domain-containing protein 124 n=1 Tax=Trichomonascus vanleenenianus TaxID=2268995 RepID=UPI003EC9EE0A